MKNIKKLLLLLLAVAIILSLIAAVGLGVGAYSESFSGMDISHIGSPENKVLTAEKILSEFLGEKLSELESEFLSEFCSFKITYSDLITTDNITLCYDDVEKTLTVTPRTYYYGNGNGYINWSPVSVALGENTVPVSYASSSAVFSDVEREASASVTVEYEADVILDPADLQILVNFYRDCAALIMEEQEYIRQMKIYEEYLHARRVYEEAQGRYNDYLEELLEYESLVQEYDNYTEAMEAYSEAYALYLEYLRVFEEYEEELLEYEAYVSYKKQVSQQLNILDMTKKQTTDGRSLYAAVMGNAVDSVLDNKSLITGAAIGADVAIVDMAGEATENLRTLLPTYFSFKTEEEKYNYYSINYEKFCENFRNLAVSLEALYKVPKVRGLLMSQEKDKKYVILVAQLVMVTNAICDGPVKNYEGKISFGSDWTIENKTVTEALGGNFLTDSDNASPLKNGYPDAVSKPKAPEVITEPKRPQRPKTPVKPDPVEQPTMPEEVFEPSEPYASVDVKTTVARLDSVEREALIADYENTEERREPNAIYYLKLSARTEKAVFGEDVTVKFYDTDGSALLYESAVREGSFAVYEGEVPEKKTDAMGMYEFNGWCDASGNAVSLMSINEDLTLYPTFKTLPFSYDVTWNLGARVITESVKAGELPSCPELPVKPDGGDFMYVFSGFDKPLSPVASNVTYTALFDRKYIVPFSDEGGAEISYDGGGIICSAYETYDNTLDISDLLDRAVKASGLTLITNRGELEFLYSDVFLMKSAGVRYIKLNVASRGGFGERYSVQLFNGDMEEITDTTVRAKATFASTVANYPNAVVYSVAGAEERKYHKFTSGANTVSFSLENSKVYRSDLEFEISALPSDGASVLCDAKIARPGERVTVKVTLDEGVELSKIIVTSGGVSVFVDESGSFVMPMGDVDVAVVTKLKMWTVTFVVGDKVISVQKLRHGEKIVMPAAPKLENDGKYSYEFLGWSEDSDVATENLTFEAEFKKTLLPEKPKEEGIILSDTVWRLVTVGIVAAVVLLSGITVGVIFLVRWLIRRCRVKNAQKNEV